MKADSKAQRNLLDLASIDIALDRNAHREATLPEKAAVNQLQSATSEAHNRVVRASTELADLSRALARAEAEVAAVRARADRDRTLLVSGNISSSKQLSDLEHEVVSLGRRQSDLEDAELEVMEAVEQTQAVLSQAQEHEANCVAQLAAAESARDSALAELAAERQELVAERASCVGLIPADLLALYERIRSHGNAVAVGLLRFGRCESCQMELSRVDLDVARGAAADEVLRCPECRAIMVRSEESGL